VGLCIGLLIRENKDLLRLELVDLFFRCVTRKGYARILYGIGMASVSNWLAGTMIFWIPVLFFTTYVGFYEAFSAARATDFLGVNYPEDYSIMLIIPAMVPTTFTAYSVLHRKRIIQDLVTRAADFHQSVLDDEEKFRDDLFNSSEFKALTLEAKIQYCRDLNLIGKYEEANKFLDIIYQRYQNSSNLRQKAVAHYCMSIFNGLSRHELHKNSKEAYQLIQDQPKDWLYFRIALSFTIDENVVNGVDAALNIISEVESHVKGTESFWGIQFLIMKMRYLYRSKRIREVDFTKLDRCIDKTELTKEEIREIGGRYFILKRTYLFDRDKDDELDYLIRNRIYFRRWTGQKVSTGLINDQARLLRKKGKYPESLKLFEENLATHLTKNEKHDNDLVVCYVNIGKTYFLMGETEEALNRAKTVYDLAEKANFIRGKIESLELIINCMEKQGRKALVESVELDELKKSHGITAQTH
jgi:tetratricopeptide (TPR) repeat protein